MAEERPSALRFSLADVVRFRKGEEIEELISLSLEPEILVQERDHYYSIRGSLNMFGEYRVARGEEEDGEEDFFNFSGPRYVDVIETREEGINEFRHDFPVDISVPKYRVRNIEELNLDIDSFDYEIPGKGELRLRAEILISGIYDEDEREEEGEAEETERPGEEGLEAEFGLLKELNGDQKEDDDYNFFVEARKSARLDEGEGKGPEEEFVPIQIFSNEEADDETKKEVPFDGEEISAPGGEPASSRKEGEIFAASEATAVKAGTESSPAEKERPALSGLRGENPPADGAKEDAGHPSGPPEWGEERGKGERTSAFFEEPEVKGKASEGTEARPGEGNDLPEQPDGGTDRLPEAEEQNGPDTQPREIHYQANEEPVQEKSVISLADIFAHKDAETKLTRWKVYFVQEEDTLQDIAEKYETNVSQLLRANGLESDHEVYPGQVLYIPETKGHLTNS